MRVTCYLYCKRSRWARLALAVGLKSRIVFNVASGVGSRKGRLLANYYVYDGTGLFVIMKDSFIDQWRRLPTTIRMGDSTIPTD